MHLVVLQCEQNDTASEFLTFDAGSITARPGKLPVTRLPYFSHQARSRRPAMFVQPPPLCPTCQTTAMPVRVTCGPSGLEIPMLQCPACHHARPDAAKPVDPLRSPRTNAWLRGQLVAPT